MATRETIQQRYTSDIDAAEAYKDHDPEKYASLRLEAANRRADALAELAEQSERTATQATLSQARTDAKAKFPLADPDAISGDTAEAIAASAERSHKFVEKAQDDARKAALEQRRPETRRAWTGRPDGARPGIPGGEIRGDEDSPLQKQAEKVYDRTAEIIEQSRLPGTVRTYSPEAMQVLRSQDPEAQALADFQILHPNTGLSEKAMRQRSEGNVAYVSDASGVPADEDKRG